MVLNNFVYVWKFGGLERLVVKIKNIIVCLMVLLIVYCLLFILLIVFQ